MSSSTQFKTLITGMCGEYQIGIEEGIHVSVYKGKIWNVRTGYDETTAVIVYDRSLLNLCCTIVDKIYRLTDPKFQDMEIIWLF